MYSSPSFRCYQYMARLIPGVFLLSSPQIIAKQTEGIFYLEICECVFLRVRDSFFLLLSTVHSSSFTIALNIKIIFRFPYCMSFTFFNIWITWIWFHTGFHTLHLVDIILKPLLFYRFPLLLFVFTALCCCSYCHWWKWSHLSYEVLMFWSLLIISLLCLTCSSIPCIFCKLAIRSFVLVSQSASEGSGMLPFVSHQ